MATSFSLFDSTPATVVADIKAAILTSTDWTNPVGSRVVATTTRGADMVVDLADAAATSKLMQLGVYRTQALADKRTQYLNWRINTVGTTADPVHCIVSAGKDHLYFSVEGPRSNEPNPDTGSYGSLRQAFFLGDLVPYFAADTVPSVVLVGIDSSGTYNNHFAYVSRNQANTASWVPAHLASLQPPFGSEPSGASSPAIQAVQRLASDGNSYLFPYVVFEDTAGLRGRIGKCFFVGYNADGSATVINDPIPNVFAKYTYGSDTYILLPPNRSNDNSNVYQAFGQTYNSNVSPSTSPVIAVPYA